MKTTDEIQADAWMLYYQENEALMSDNCLDELPPLETYTSEYYRLVEEAKKMSLLLLENTSGIEVEKTGDSNADLISLLSILSNPF